MGTFMAKVTEDVQANRLLKIANGEDLLEVSRTDSGEQPDFHSTRALEEGEQVRAEIKNDPIWPIEAGEDLSVGTKVVSDNRGRAVAGDEGVFGYVAEAVEEGEIAKVIRQGGGTPGPQGPPGETQFTPEQVDDLLDLINGDD